MTPRTRDRVFYVGATAFLATILWSVGQGWNFW